MQGSQGERGFLGPPGSIGPPGAPVCYTFHISGTQILGITEQ